MREKLEYWIVVCAASMLGRVPRSLARRLVELLAAAVYCALPRLRAVGARNLELALPGVPSRQRRRILHGAYRHLGWQLAEFCRMSRYSAENTRGWIRTEGLDRYLEAQARGKGVLILTGHLGAWELSSFYHSMMGHPMGMVIRRLDNRRLDAWVNAVRCRHGNQVIHKDDFGRALLTSMREGGTVGILMDTNMTPPQGEFVEFFGRAACTATGLARISLKTGAAILPGFMLWEKSEGRYVLHFGPEIEIARTGGMEADILQATAQCAAVTEAWIRRYPDQWLWIHRRWKTRPAGEPGLY